MNVEKLNPVRQVLFATKPNRTRKRPTIVQESFSHDTKKKIDDIHQMMRQMIRSKTYGSNIDDTLINIQKRFISEEESFPLSENEEGSVRNENILKEIDSVLVQLENIKEKELYDTNHREIIQSTDSVSNESVIKRIDEILQVLENNKENS